MRLNRTVNLFVERVLKAGKHVRISRPLSNQHVLLPLAMCLLDFLLGLIYVKGNVNSNKINTRYHKRTQEYVY